VIRFCLLGGVIAIVPLLAEVGAASGYDSPNYEYDGVVSFPVAPCTGPSNGDLTEETSRHACSDPGRKPAESIEERVRLAVDLVAPSGSPRTGAVLENWHL